MRKVGLLLLGVSCSSRNQLRWKRPRQSLHMERRSVPQEVKLAPFASLLMSFVVEPERIRVCNRGGSGACSQGAGDRMISALRFLCPCDGPEIVDSSCLARCQKAVPVMLPSGEVVDSLNGPYDSARILRDLGYSVDKRLVDAFAAAQDGDIRALAGSSSQALSCYKRAFSLALSGAGLGFRSRPSVIRYLQDVQAERIRAIQNSTILEGLRIKSSSKREETADSLAQVTGFGQFNFEIPVTSCCLTRAQVRWMARIMIRRSQAYSRLAQPTADAPLGQKYAEGCAIRDAQYAVQIAKTCAFMKMKEPILSQAWERLAESYEAVRNVEGAILAYDELLAYEPATTPGLPPKIVFTRGVQELILVSHRRGREDTTVVATSLQEVGEQSRKALTARAIDDVEELRKRADDDVDKIARAVRNDLDNFESFLLRVESNLVLAAPSKYFNVSGKFASFASTALVLVESIRNKTRFQFNALELLLLRGDPLLAFVRDFFRDNALLLQQQANKGLRRDVFTRNKVSRNKEKEDTLSDTDSLIWLRDKVRLREFAWIRQDQLLVASLLEEAKRNPELVKRLVSEAQEATDQKQPQITGTL